MHLLPFVTNYVENRDRLDLLNTGHFRLIKSSKQNKTQTITWTIATRRQI